MSAMARVLVFWTRPYHLSAEQAELWALEEASRLLALDAVERAELTHLASASERHPHGWDWMLELHLAAHAQHAGFADGAPCAEWLADLCLLGLRPVAFLADGSVAPPAKPR